MSINPKYGGTRGYTLVEMMVVLVVMSVMISFGIPQFSRTLEQSRADVAGANLRAIWTAERIYWLDNRTYTSSLPVLVSLNLLDPAIPTDTSYTYLVPAADTATFTATATRQPTSPGQALSRSRRTADSAAHSYVRPKALSWSASSEMWRSMKVARDSFLTSGLRSGRRRRGFSLLEVQIAFVLLGISLAGLCPFVVMQLRQLVNLESRFMATSYTFQRIGAVSYTAPFPPPSYYTTPSFIASGRPAPPPSPYYYYLVPWNNPWAQKLTTRAQLLTTPSNTTDPTVTSQPAAGFPHVTQPQAVSLTLDVNGNVTAVTAVVQVN